MEKHSHCGRGNYKNENRKYKTKTTKQVINFSQTLLPVEASEPETCSLS